jgi:hypothetical protein
MVWGGTLVTDQAMEWDISCHTYPSANNELVINDTKSIVFRAEDQFLGFKGSL